MALPSPFPLVFSCNPVLLIRLFSPCKHKFSVIQWPKAQESVSREAPGTPFPFLSSHALTLFYAKVFK